jgi:hypothetical protein
LLWNVKDMVVVVAVMGGEMDVRRIRWLLMVRELL